ncbi:hypothetical protein N7533_003315 [Penicillium manginii]|uniref:uncharacterized protein n=1 Tax=Penicillium manginii TaxID=203109 RepID=UPI002547E1CC|nr:uncharacterized protein N7533_003315 [Penicillium manginii]KAJ5764634.1 hypothetical protein N7533_003315 [Penicillium manginii]
MNPSASSEMSGMDVLGLHISNPSSKASHAHPYASSIASSASSSSSSVFSLDASQSSISSTATNPVDVIWENDVDNQQATRPSVACPRAFVKGVHPKIDGPVPPELRTHPRRTNVAANGPGARPPPCLLRQSERKVSFVDNLVDTASQIVENIWPLSAAASRSDAATGSKGVLPLRTFIQETLRRSRTSYSTLQVALYYLIKIKPHVPCNDFTREQSRDQSATRAMQCGRRMFLAALILASKYLQDRNYSARAWSKISGLNTLEINQNELMFLQAVGWRLHISEATFQRWTDLVLKLTPGAGGPPASEGQCWRTVLPGLTPELDLVDSEPMTPVSAMGGMDLGLAESPSPRCAASNESIRSTSREQTPTCQRSLARNLEPTSRMDFVNLPMPSLPRPQMLPTPPDDPPNPCCLRSCCERGNMWSPSPLHRYGDVPGAEHGHGAIHFGSAPAFFVLPSGSVIRWIPRNGPPVLSGSVNIFSVVARFHGFRRVDLVVALFPLLIGLFYCFRHGNSLKESRKTLAIASPIDESALADLYSSPDYPGAMGSAPDLSQFSLDSSLSEAAQSLCELSGATTERRQCRKRGRTGSDDMLLQNHVRHLINVGASGVPSSILPDGHLATSFLMAHGPSVSGPAGMKRACCGSEARKIALNPSIRADYLN